MGKVFLAADGSAHSKRALEKAIQLAKASDASIDIVHVVSAKESKEAALNSTGKIDLETKRQQMLQPLFDQIVAAGLEYE
ncbi:MAG: universal stress protein, partial [Exiguobacterium chiriqhucha]